MIAEITPALLNKLKTSIDPSDSHRNLAERAVTTNGIYAASEKYDLSATNTTVFSDEVASGSVTNQKESGRCWLFATLNTIRHQIEVEYKIDDFELSESYSYFWDKLERANTFYQKVIHTYDIPLDEWHMIHLLSRPQEDGGWWEYSAAVIAKYGIVPKSVMPESIATSKSHQLNTLLNRKLRKDALRLRKLGSQEGEEALQEAKETMLAEVYRIITVAIGTPPEKFDYSYRDTKKKLHRETSITPKQFFSKYSNRNFDDYISVMNYPAKDKPYLQTYSFEGGGNIISGKEPVFLNVDMETLKGLTYQQIKKGESVWFACDTRLNMNKAGFMSPDVYDFASTFRVDFDFDKADRLKMRETSVDHAMTITGVDTVKGRSRQWKVENSWGDEYGKKGYYTMSDDWFTENGYVVVIHKDLLSEQLLAATKMTPIKMHDWDPLNTQFAPIPLGE